MKMMFKSLAFVGALVVLPISSAAASVVEVTGQITKMRSLSTQCSSTLGCTDESRGTSWIKIKDITSVAGCPQHPSQGLIFNISKNDNQIIETARAAKLQQVTVTLHLNTSIIVDQSCTVEAISLD